MSGKWTELPEFEDWKSETLLAYFFGQPIAEMDRDQLLAVIGFLVRQERSRRRDVEASWPTRLKSVDSSWPLP